MIRRSPFASHILAAIACFGADAAQASDYYVDPVHGDDSGPGTAAQPFKDYWALDRVLKPGDTGHIGAGNYPGGFWITASGNAAHDVTIVGDPKNMPHVWTTASTMAILFAQGTHNVTLKGFDVKATGSDGNASGIWALPGANHITISGNKVHDCTAAGIGGYGVDYIKIVGNIVHDNSKTGNQDASGIDLYQLQNVDNNTTSIHNLIVSNTIYNNANLVPITPGGIPTDGNGIIVDDSRHTQHGNTAPAYQGETLIENNVIFNNSGRGIHIFESDDVFVTNNTIALNNWQYEEYATGEVLASHSGNIHVYNNILVPLTQTRHFGFLTYLVSGGQVAGDYNLTYGGASAVYLDPNSSALQFWGTHNRIGNPLFIDLSASAAAANFGLRAGSPAFGMGQPALGSRVDLTGAQRTGSLTVGAYQYTSH